MASTTGFAIKFDFAGRPASFARHHAFSNGLAYSDATTNLAAATIFGSEDEVLAAYDDTVAAVARGWAPGAILRATISIVEVSAPVGSTSTPRTCPECNYQVGHRMDCCFC